MKALRPAPLLFVLASVFVLGIGLGRRVRSKPSPEGKTAEEPEPSPRTPRNERELAATLAKATSLYCQSDFEGAAECYEAATRYVPQDIALRLKLVRLYVGDDRWFLALPHLKQVLRERPDCAEAHFELSRIFAGRGRAFASQAKTHATRAAELGFRIPESHLQELERLEKENERAKREGRPHPDDPLAGLDRPLVLR